MHASDVITYVAKQNMNVMALTFSAEHEALERQKQNVSVHQNNLVTCYQKVPYILTKYVYTST